MKGRLILTVLCAGLACAQFAAAQSISPAVEPAPAGAPAAAKADTPEDLQALRAKIDQQQEQIKRLEQAVEEQRKLLDQSLAAMNATNKSTATTTDGTAVVATSGTPSDQAQVVPAVNVARPNIGMSPHQRGVGGVAGASPLSISIGNTQWTPLGFLDMTFFARSTNVGSGIGTNFEGIPYNNVAAGRLSETNFSAQNSRIGFRVDSTFMGAKVLGYLEADFLFNNNAASYQITSNSAGFRLRNYFVDWQKDSFEVLGGQDWSFLTPNRKGLSPLPADIFYTNNMDTNYQAGLIWTRAPQFRFIYHATENFGIGLALENPQQYIGGGSGASTVVLPTNLASALEGNQFNNGTSNSSTNVPNLFPNIILKAAYDAHVGEKLFHLEAAGLITGFKDYVTVTAPPAVPGSHTAWGGGGEFNMNLEVAKGVRLVENFYASDGGGRYIFGLAPDLTVRPNGSIAPLHSYSTLDGIEAQVSKNTLLAAYYGGAYVGREVFLDPTSKPGKPVFVGYGYSNSFTRAVQEFTLDWTQTLWKSANYGALSLINQYSYVLRNPWVIPTAGPKSAHTNMVYIDLRYTLP